MSLAAGDGAWLEWLPQETILFDGARLVRRIAADLAPGARLLAAETLVFGRAARGERFTRGLLHEGWRLSRGGPLVWADALRLEDDVARRLASPAGFGGALALATALYVGEDAAALLPAARALAEAGEGGGDAGQWRAAGALPRAASRDGAARAHALCRGSAPRRFRPAGRAAAALA